jgi:hypothetical protein
MPALLMLSAPEQKEAKIFCSATSNTLFITA